MKSCVIPLPCRKWSVGHPQQEAQLPGKCGKVGWMHLTQRVGMGTCRSYFALSSEGESISGAEMPQRIHSTAQHGCAAPGLLPFLLLEASFHNYSVGALTL